MNKSGISQIIWGNLAALMQHHWGEVHLQRLADEARVAQSTISRLKTMESSPTADMLHKLARVFRLQAWQLLDPMLDPRTAGARAVGLVGNSAPPQWPFETLTPEQFARISPGDKARVEGFAMALVPRSDG